MLRSTTVAALLAATTSAMIYPSDALSKPRRDYAVSKAYYARVKPRLIRIARCESGMNPRAISPGGLYRGLLQFSIPTWRSVGGYGDPINAPAREQLRRGAILYSRTGPSSWPVCGYR